MAKKHVSDPKYVQKNYTNPKLVGSFSGLKTFVRNRRIKNVKQTENALNEIPAFSLFRERKRKPTRRPIILWQPFDLISCDLIDLHNLKRSNRGYSYIFLFVDGFTKFITIYKLKTKSIADVKHALLQFIKQSKGKLKTLLSDHESALMSREVQNLFKKENITHIASKTPRKASHAEVALKNVKNKLFRMMEYTGRKNWIDNVDDIVHSTNSTIHSSTGKIPSQVTVKDYSDIYMRLYSKLAQRKRTKPVFKVNEIVRITAPRITFDRSFTPNWSRERFKIKSIHTTFPVISYKLQDLQGNPIESTYTESDLQRASQNDIPT